MQSRHRHPLTRRTFLSAVALAPLLASCAGSPVLRQANIQPVSPQGLPSQVPAPTLKVGDRWEYSQHDAITGLVSNRAQIRIVGITPEGYQVAEDWKDGGNRDALYDRELNPIRTYNLSYQPAFPQFSFPLAVGKTWEGQVIRRDIPSQRYGTLNETVKGAVSGWERLTVPAGTFTAMRVDVTFTWRDTDASGLFGNTRETIWYASEVRNFVLQHREVFYHGLQISEDAFFQLEAFSVG